uniref:Uncharacterized protein n=1 Tax=Ciona savignyi TaxID=51511 RepID=H2ZQ81_CIOSA
MAGGITACVVIIIIVVIVTTVTCCRLKQKNQSHAGMSMSNRLTTPPDGKSCSNIVETESDRPSPVGETTNCDTDTPVTPKPKAAYYLAQRQLQLMKKLGTQDSVQVYTSSCANDQNIRQQEALLFGHLSESETAT